MIKPPVGAPDLSALSTLAPELAATFVSVASDIALVIDADGVIRNVAVGGDPITPQAAQWVGRAWVDTVTGNTRRKVEQLLQEVGSTGLSRRREVNHPSPGGLDVPVAYAAVRLGHEGLVLAVGRDLRAIAAIQQRFIESQQELEREYWQLRQAEARYRLMFQVATDAVLVVDALTLHTVEANRAASELFGLEPEQLVGAAAVAGLALLSRPPVEELLVCARSTGRSAEIRARLAGRPATIDISATPFRGQSSLLLLVRARAVEERVAGENVGDKLGDFVERMPDAVLITDSSGRVLMANPAFLVLAGLAVESQIVGLALGDWEGDPQRRLQAGLVEARRHGIARSAEAMLRRGGGDAVGVEVSAVLLDEGEQECIGFTLRQAAGPGRQQWPGRGRRRRRRAGHRGRAADGAGRPCRAAPAAARGHAAGRAALRAAGARCCRRRPGRCRADPGHQRRRPGSPPACGWASTTACGRWWFRGLPSQLIHPP